MYIACRGRMSLETLRVTEIITNIESHHGYCFF